MKGFIRLTILLTLATLILFTGSGFTLSKMLCAGSGKIKYSLTQQKSCCNNEKDCATVHSKCCDISNEVIKIDSFKLDKGFNLAPIHLFAKKLFCSLESGFINPSLPIVLNYSWPPLSGVKLLKLISTFLI